MAAENPTWRAPRIHGELLMLGYKVSERTVSRYLPKRPPDQDKIRQWKTFLENHRHAIAAMDLFTIPLGIFRVLYAPIAPWSSSIMGGVFCFTRSVSFNPTTLWVVQQLRDVGPSQASMSKMTEKGRCSHDELRPIYSWRATG